MKFINECTYWYREYRIHNCLNRFVHEVPSCSPDMILKNLFCKVRIFEALEVKAKVKQSRNRPGVAQRVPGGLGSQIS